MVNKGDELHVFIEIVDGIVESVRVFIEIVDGIVESVLVTSDESEVDNWENDWLHNYGYEDMDDYLYELGDDHPSNIMHTHIAKLE